MKWLGTLAVACGVLVAGPALAQKYPDRPVRVVVPFVPGGPYDVMVRPLASALEAKLGQPFVIEYRAGASGNIGASYVAKSAPADGYTLLAFAGSLVLNAAMRSDLPFDTVKDLRAVSPMAVNDFILVTNPKLGAKTIADLVKMAKAQPGKLNFASNGIGASLHLIAEWFKVEAGIDMVHVPYNGAAAMVTETVSGTVQMAIPSMPPAVPLIKAGKLTPLAVFSDHRVRALPDVPTMRESGYDMVTQSMYGLVAPAATPTEVVDLLNREIRVVLDDPKIGKIYRDAGVEPFWLPPEKLGEYIRNEIARWKDVAAKAGIKGQ